MNRQRKNTSLKFDVLFIAIICWFIPLALVLTFLVLDATNRDNKLFDEEVSGLVNEIARKISADMTNLVASSRYVSYDPTILNAHAQYIADGDTQALYDNVMVFMNNRFKFDDNISATLLYFTGVPKVYYTINAKIPSAQSKYSYYQENVHAETVRISETLGTGIGFYNSGDYLYMIRNIVNSDYETVAVIIFRLNDGLLFNLISEISWFKSGVVYLNSTTFIITQNSSPDRKHSLKMPDKDLIHSGTHKVNHMRDLIWVEGREKVDGVDILYSIEFDKKGIRRGLSDFGGIAYGVVIAFIPMLIICIRFFTRHIFTPIKNLTEAAKKIENGELGITVQGNPPNKEFNYLTESFDKMSVRIKDQFHRIYNEELALRDAKIMALQMQINPHFLNNTLEIINWEARLGNNGKVSRMIEALSSILDAATARNQETLITLQQEISYLDSYLYIISERFAKQLSVKKEIDRSLMGIEVPRLIIQPIIENALEHGMTAGGRTEIKIHVKRSENKLFIIIENNTPLDEKNKKRIDKFLSPNYSPSDSGSLGIYNVNMRLKMIFGEECGLKIIGEDDKTLSIITIFLK